jgi:hypothetical protein
VYSKLRAGFGAQLSKLLDSASEVNVLRRACYLAVPLYVCGFVVLGAAFQKKLSIGAVVMGWGIAEVSIMINTVAICG